MNIYETGGLGKVFAGELNRLFSNLIEKDVLQVDGTSASGGHRYAEVNLQFTSSFPTNTDVEPILEQIDAKAEGMFGKCIFPGTYISNTKGMKTLGRRYDFK